MTLTERLARVGGVCRVEGCQRVRMADALYCRDHVNELWRSAHEPRLPEWLRLARLRPLGLARDETGRSVL